MDILGIGIPELVFIALIVLIILGPEEMKKTGTLIGKGLRKFVMSDVWKVVRETNREIELLPNRLMRDAGEDSQAEDDSLSDGKIDDARPRDAWTRKPAIPVSPVTRAPMPEPGGSRSVPEAKKDSPAPQTNVEVKDA